MLIWTDEDLSVPLTDSRTSVASRPWDRGSRPPADVEHTSHSPAALDSRRRAEALAWTVAAVAPVGPRAGSPGTLTATLEHTLVNLLYRRGGKHRTPPSAGYPHYSKQLLLAFVSSCRDLKDSTVSPPHGTGLLSTSRCHASSPSPSPRH